MRKLTLLLLCLGLGLAACSRASGPTGPTPIENEIFAPELNIDLSQMTRTESGLYLQDLIVGEGAVAESGKEIRVHYIGRLVDGRTFDSSVGGQPLTFTLGVGRVIKGWDEGIVGMRVGGTRKLVIPSSLAYGSKKNGPIPAYATLVFEVALIDVQEDEEDA